jgi:hypothetical protein
MGFPLVPKQDNIFGRGVPKQEFGNEDITMFGTLKVVDNPMDLCSP